MRRIALFVGAAWAVGCAEGRVSVPVVSPAPQNLGAVKRIAVVDFGVDGAVSTLDGARVQRWGPLALSLGGSASAHAPLPIPATDAHPMTAEEAGYAGRELARRLSSQMARDGYFQVVAYEQVRRELHEQTQHSCDMLTPEQARRLGKRLGVDALVLGQAHATVTDGGRWVDDVAHFREDERSKVLQVHRRVELEVVYSVIDAHTGRVLTADRAAAARGRADLRPSPWRSLFSWAASDVAEEVVRRMTPNTVVEQRRLLDGRSDEVAEGNALAQHDLWAEARRAWEAVLVAERPREDQDRLAATHNLAVYYERDGDLLRAVELYRECRQRFDASACRRAERRLEHRLGDARVGGEPVSQ